MRQNAKGFTLVELMMVIAIAAILAMIGTLVVVSTIPSYNLTRAARDMVSNFRKARSMAIKFNRPVMIEFNVDAESYTIDGLGINKAVSIAEQYGGIRLGFPGRSTKVSFPDNKFTFTSTGLTPGLTGGVGYAYVQNRNKQGYRIGISSLAANVVMEKCGARCVAEDGSDGVIDCTKNEYCTK
ncbi:MAG: GspH/FimT family pseudopilin [Deltaproteobacteria bacterium]|nr:GspH/FimT family pseudopilin [Deltaproteobacteria bacterium]